MGESKYIHKSHNVSLLLYQIVCPAKYRRVVFSDSVDMTLKDICLEISKRYQIYFLEIGTDDDHVHFLVQSVPMYSPTKIVTIIKSITAREILSKNPEVKKKLWGGEFWTDGYFINTVSKHGNEDVISKYVRDQGVEKQYKVLHKVVQLSLF
jgi:REP element-mobilizing transposase RayT